VRAYALLLGFVCTAGTLQAQATAVVSGVVRDEVGRPIPEALVVIDPDSLSLRARTSAAGRFRISGVPSGSYEVRVVRIGFRPHSRRIEVAGRELEFEVELSSVPIPLDTVAVRASRPGLHGLVVTRGISLLPHEPRAIRGAQVEALNTPHTVRTGADGRFSMPQLPAGAHAVFVTLDGYVTRMVPVTVPYDGGVEIMVTIDSLYAEYQRWDEADTRSIGWRVRRATSPATFVPLHDIDLDAKDLRDGIRYSYSLLSRGLVIRGGCIYLNGKPRTELELQDIDPEDVVALEVYPPGTLQDPDRLPPFPIGTPCERLWGTSALDKQASRGRAQSRVAMRARGNILIAIVVWTRGRR
jgi:Carboxypeptidase regulatory-like domain